MEKGGQIHSHIASPKPPKYSKSLHCSPFRLFISTLFIDLHDLESNHENTSQKNNKIEKSSYVAY